MEMLSQKLEGAFGKRRLSKYPTLREGPNNYSDPLEYLQMIIIQ